MASDPSQFAQDQQQAAVSRRLAGSQNQQLAPFSGTPSQNNIIPLPAWNEPGGNPSLTPDYYNAKPVQQNQLFSGNPANPLSGGTGDPTLDSYLGTDTTYQGQLSDLMRNYDQYNAQRNLTATQTQADYDAKMRALNDQSAQDQLNMRNQAAARGILYSGIYANQLGQYNTANQQQLTNLLGGLQNSKDNAQLAYNQFIANELAAKQNAIQQAVARRSQTLGQF